MLRVQIFYNVLNDSDHDVDEDGDGAYAGINVR